MSGIVNMMHFSQHYHILNAMECTNSRWRQASRRTAPSQPGPASGMLEQGERMQSACSAQKAAPKATPSDAYGFAVAGGMPDCQPKCAAPLFSIAKQCPTAASDASAAELSRAQAPGSGVDAVAIDVEYVHMVLPDGRQLSAPAWVALVDHQCQLLLKTYTNPLVSTWHLCCVMSIKCCSRQQESKSMCWHGTAITKQTHELSAGWAQNRCYGARLVMPDDRTNVETASTGGVSKLSNSFKPLLAPPDMRNGLPQNRAHSTRSRQ